jgi:chloramphenicol-sensitive protein RarD
MAATAPDATAPQPATLAAAPSASGVARAVPESSALPVDGRRLNGKGLSASVVAFVIWGVFPLYFLPLRAVGTVEVIAHRIVWSCVLILILMASRGELGKLKEVLISPALLWRLASTAALISVNWLAYVFAVTNGHVLEASLGYFINPLINVILGVLLLSERLNRVQWASVGLAGIAVLYLAFVAGNPPWISLIIAASFALYGFVRKTVAVEALPGLAVETLLLAPLAAGYLLWLEHTGTGSLGHAGWGIDALLVGSGPLTAIPLFLFAYGARLIPFSTVGVIQYIAPSLQLLTGLFAFGEAFEHTRAVGFSLIWAGLALYVVDGLWRSRKANA